MATKYECDACGEEYETLQEVIFHRQTCMTPVQAKYAVAMAHKVVLNCANAINDLRGKGYSEREVETMLETVSVLQKQLG